MNNFKIKLPSSNNGKSLFSFSIKDSFFEEFPFSEIKHASICANGTIYKERGKTSLSLIVSGKINNLPCDICTEDLSVEISAETNMIIKRTNENLFSNDEVYYVKKTENKIDLKQLIFELITLNIPKKRRHPLNEKGNIICNKEMIELVEKYKQKQKQTSDPRWDVLKNLK